MKTDKKRIPDTDAAIVRLVADALCCEAMAGKLGRVPGGRRTRFRVRPCGTAPPGSFRPATISTSPSSVGGVNGSQHCRQAFLLQADLWAGVKDQLGLAAPVVFVGSPSRFYCWLEAAPERPSGYVTPFDSPGTVADSLEAVLAGAHRVSDAIRKLLCVRAKERQQILLKERLITHLTPSELEVLALVGQGYTTSEIAGLRVRSVHTVKTQRKQVRRKLGLGYGERLATFAGREAHGLKTLLMIKRNSKLLSEICRNTP